MLGSRMRCHVSSGGTPTTSCSGAATAPPMMRSRRVTVQCFQQQAMPRMTANKVKLSFKLPYRCSFGQELCMVGSGDALGNWSVENGKRMQWTDGDVWQVAFEVSAGPQLELEYKYVVRQVDGCVLEWKPGDNCQIKVPVLLQEEKAIAEGVLVRDVWDGSIQDIELEVVGGSAHGAAGLQEAFTEEQERAAVQSAVDRALHELSQAMSSSVAVQGHKLDPTAPEVLQADRLVAAAARKAVAMHRALEASRTLQQLPSSVSTTPGSNYEEHGHQQPAEQQQHQPHEA